MMRFNRLFAYIMLVIAVNPIVAEVEGNILIPPGKARIEVTSSRPARIFIFREETLMELGGQKKKINEYRYWEYKIEDKAYFKSYCETKKDAERDQITENFFAIADSGFSTPHVFENVAAGKYLIWVSTQDGNKLRCGFDTIWATDTKPIKKLFFLEDFKIQVTSNPPGFPIRVNDAETQFKTPHTLTLPYSIVPESLKISLGAPGYYERATGDEALTQTVFQSNEKVNDVAFDLVEEATAPKRMYEVDADPGPAEIFVNNHSYGETPLQLKIPIERPNVTIWARKPLWIGCTATMAKPNTQFEPGHKHCSVTLNPEKSKIHVELERAWARGFFIAAMGSPGLGSITKSYTPYWGGALGWHGESSRPFGWFLNTYLGYSQNIRKNMDSCSNKDLCPVGSLWLADFNLSVGPNVSLWRFGLSVGLGTKLSVASGGGNTAFSFPVTGILTFLLPTDGSLLFMTEYVGIKNLVENGQTADLLRIGFGYVWNGFYGG